MLNHTFELASRRLCAPQQGRPERRKTRPSSRQSCCTVFSCLKNTVYNELSSKRTALLNPQLPFDLLKFRTQFAHLGFQGLEPVRVQHHVV